MIEDDLMIELKTIAVIRLLSMLYERGELGDFLEFAKEKAKEDGMDSDEFIGFLDELGEIADKENEEPVSYQVNIEVKKL